MFCSLNWTPLNLSSLVSTCLALLHQWFWKSICHKYIYFRKLPWLVFLNKHEPSKLSLLKKKNSKEAHAVFFQEIFKLVFIKNRVWVKTHFLTEGAKTGQKTHSLILGGLAVDYCHWPPLNPFWLRPILIIFPVQNDSLTFRSTKWCLHRALRA